nr:unnamed protein product [Haemonchus contortus]
MVDCSCTPLTGVDCGLCSQMGQFQSLRCSKGSICVKGFLYHRLLFPHAALIVMSFDKTGKMEYPHSGTIPNMENG